jgi:cytidine deaminase
MPELVFAIVAPIGVNLDLVVSVLDQSLTEKRYTPRVIRLTQLMADVPTKLTMTDSVPFVASYQDKIAYANEVRKLIGDDALAALAVSAIRTHRKDEWTRRRLEEGEKSAAVEEAQESVPISGAAYILRQLKRPEEISLLRSVYGRHVVVISAYAPQANRERQIRDMERASRGGHISDFDADQKARALVIQDSNEVPDEHGQNVRDAFPLGDVFIDATSEATCQKTLGRFMNLFFGKNAISPSIDEYGMYLAKSASLRSCDLSRQVGAAIFTTKREIISLGCNEVPKAGGGTYWSGDDDDHRDIVIGKDPNEKRKIELIVDVIHRLRSAGQLSPELTKIEDPYEITKRLLKTGGALAIGDSQVMDLLEFSRVIHAEMNAICDAARKGSSVQDAVLYCTTFPCHMCAKHIVASGISRVIYLEPYPKSYAAELHGDSIDTQGGACGHKVVFEPFIGVSPYRYRDLFEKGRRKYSGGAAQIWNKGELRPMIDRFHPPYFQAETRVASELESKLKSLPHDAAAD